MTWVEGVAAVTTSLAILCFILYVIALMWQPTGERPLITPLDRFGQPLPPDENPDYRETEEERDG
jgi:hypothetical protein